MKKLITFLQKSVNETILDFCPLFCIFIIKYRD